MKDSGRKSPNVQEFRYSIIFLLVVVYLVHTHLLFVSRAYNELQIVYRNVKYLMIPSYVIELKLLDRYLTPELNSFWLKNLFLVALEGFWWQHAMGGGSVYGVKSIRSKKQDWNLNLKSRSKKMVRVLVKDMIRLNIFF